MSGEAELEAGGKANRWRGGGLRSVLLWTLGFALLSVAWATAAPPGRGADETAQYIKTMGTALGQWNGDPVVGASEFRQATRQGELNARLIRVYWLPASLRPDPRWPCAAKPNESARCLDRPLRPSPTFSWTHMGTYPPVPYLLLGSVARWMGTGLGALYAGRITGALLAVALLGGAFAATPRGWARLGVAIGGWWVVALSWQLTTSGLEIAAGVAQATAVVAIAADPRRRWVWGWYAVSGVSLALIRPFGPYLVALYAFLALVLLGRRALELRREPVLRTVIAAVATVAVSAAATLIWSSVAMPSVAVSVSEALGNVPESFRRSITGGHLFLGPLRFGGGQPWRAAAASGAFVLVVIGALWLGTLRDRWTLALAILLAALVNLGLDAATQIPYAYNYQSRFGLPLTTFVPIFAASVIGRRRHRFPALLRGTREVFVLTAISLTVVLVQAFDWWRAARLAAVGLDGPWFFPGTSSSWAPTMSWRVPVAFYAAAVAVLVVVSVLNARAVRNPVGAGTIP